MDKPEVELVFQVGVVVNSVDETLANLRKYFRIDEASVAVKSTKDKADAGIRVENMYNGRPCEFYIKTARLNLGGIDLEYVEPLNKEGGDPYSDWLKEHGQGIQHINMKLSDRSLIDHMMEEEGIPPHIWSRTGDLVLETYDFREKFGFIAELGDMVVGPMAEQYYQNREKEK